MTGRQADHWKRRCRESAGRVRSYRSGIQLSCNQPQNCRTEWSHSALRAADSQTPAGVGETNTQLNTLRPCTMLIIRNTNALQTNCYCQRYDKEFVRMKSLNQFVCVSHTKVYVQNDFNHVVKLTSDTIKWSPPTSTLFWSLYLFCPLKLLIFCNVARHLANQNLEKRNTRDICWLEDICLCFDILVRENISFKTCVVLVQVYLMFSVSAWFILCPFVEGWLTSLNRK